MDRSGVFPSEFCLFGDPDTILYRYRNDVIFETFQKQKKNIRSASPISTNETTLFLVELPVL